MAVIRCPNCGKPNPEFLEVCQYCDTPLPGGSAPAAGAPARGTPRPVGADDDTLIRPPAWDEPAAGAPARGAPRPVGADDDTLIRPPAWDEPAAGEPAQPAAPDADDTMPDWMARLRQRREGEAPPDEPDWMWTGAAADNPPDDSAPPVVPPTTKIEPEVTGTNSLPPWLAELSGEAATDATPGDDLPAWLKDDALNEPGASDVTLIPRPRRKMTEWLSSMKAEAAQAEAPASQPEPPAAEAPAPSAPASGTGPLSGPAPSGPDQPASDMPEWLQKLRGGASETPPASPTGGTGGIGARIRQQEMPERLRPKITAADPLVHRHTDLEPPPSEPPAASGAALPSDTALPSGDMPGWLRSILAAQTAPEAAVPAPVPAEPAPPEAHGAEASPAPSPTEGAPTGEPERPKKKMTDWLGSVLDRPVEPVAADDLMPSWLQALSAETAVETSPAEAAPEPVPDWLKNDYSSTGTVAAAPADMSARVIPEEAPAKDEALPDWLTQMQATQAAAEPEPPQPSSDTAQPSEIAQPSDTTQPSDIAQPSDEMPDWLRAMTPKDTGPLGSSSPAPRTDMGPIGAPAGTAVPTGTGLPTDDMPSWMAQLESPEPVATTPAPEAFPVPAPPAPSDEMPDWLMAMAPDAAAASAPKMEAPPASGDDATSEDMPDWLKAMAPPEAAAPAAAASMASTAPAADAAPVAPGGAAMPSGELPDWLRHLTPVEAGAPTEPPAKPPSELQTLLEADEPDYLRGLRPGSPPLSAEPEPAATEDVPEWLKSLGDAAFASQAQFADASEADSAAIAQQPAPASDAAEPVPEPITWLRNRVPSPTPVETTAADAEPKVPADRTSKPADIANWLASLAHPELATPTSPATPGAETPSTPSTPSELPAWLQDAAPVAESADDALAWLAPSRPATGPLGASQAPAEAEGETAATAGGVPEWLRALRTEPASAEETSPDAMPDWLRSLRGLPARAEAPAEGEPAALVEAEIAATALAVPSDAEVAGLQTSSLPDWLAAMRPIDIAHPGASEADSYEETLGVLAGMRGVLRAEPAVAQPHTATPVTQALAISAAHASHAQILADLAQADATRLPARHVPARMAALAERWIIFAALALAIWLAQFQFPGLFPVPATISPETRAAYNLVAALQPDKPALIAFDYDAAQQGELSPGASILASHLMARGIPVVAISLVPTGAGVGQQVLTSAAAALGARSGATLTYGSQYINLGYVAGGPVGLLQFAASPRAMQADDFTGAFRDGDNPLWAAPAVRNVQQLSDFGLIVLASGSPDGTRAWIEQARSFAPDVPTIALVSASAEPMVRPYFEAAGSPLDGLIVGMGGAAQYEQQSSVAGEASQRWPAMGGGLLAAAVLIALGGLISAGLGGLGAVRRRVKR